MGRLRIVAGRFGGRRIDVPTAGDVRPTREMVREAWFSALGDRVAGARVLDLFAGSGALGIEALSRGATSVVFVESDRRCAAVLAASLEELGAEEGTRIVRDDVGAFLSGRRVTRPFDLALADPPYGSDWPERLVDALAARPFARLLCVEHRPGALEGGEGIVWSRTYGDTALSFLAPPARGTESGRKGGREPA